MPRGGKAEFKALKHIKNDAHGAEKVPVRLQGSSFHLLFGKTVFFSDA